MTRRLPLSVAALLLLGGLGACGPVPVAQAERACLDDARAATGPRSEVGVGVATDGDRVWTGAGFEVSLSSDYVMGRDPSDVFNSCVMRRSGQPPTRPLSDQPGWRG